MKITMLLTAVISVLVIIFTGCGSSTDEIMYTGIVEGETHTVSSPFSDRLETLSVTEGDWVKKGEILGTINDNSLKLQLKGLYSNWDQIKLQRQDMAITLEQISESFNHYNAKYQKNLALSQQEAVSDQTVKDLKLQVDKWNRDRRSAELKLQVLSSQEENIQYQIAQIEDTREKAVLTAFTEGYIDKIYFEVGEFIPPLRPVMELINLNNIWCYIYLTESELVDIKPGDPAEGRAADHVFAGKIMHINSKSEFSPKEILSPDNRKALVYAVKVNIKNPDKILKIGMPIDIYLNKVK